MKILKISMVLVAMLVAGCATKHYGRQGNVTEYEKTTMTCREIDLEMAKVDGFIDRVWQESRFSGKDVLAIAGDFGIGNKMERNAALKSAKERKLELSKMRTERGCNSEAPALPAAGASSRNGA